MDGGVSTEEDPSRTGETPIGCAEDFVQIESPERMNKNTPAIAHILLEGYNRIRIFSKLVSGLLSVGHFSIRGLSAAITFYNFFH
jgi:hypothetical protein